MSSIKIRHCADFLHQIIKLVKKKTETVTIKQYHCLYNN